MRGCEFAGEKPPSPGTESEAGPEGLFPGQYQPADPNPVQRSQSGPGWPRSDPNQRTQTRREEGRKHRAMLLLKWSKVDGWVEAGM